MKPIPYIRSNQRDLCRDIRAQRNQQNRPLTDCFYQSIPIPSGSSAPISGDAFLATKPRTFRKLSSDFFATETSRDYIAEFALFSLITGVSAWPIISMIVALHGML